MHLTWAIACVTASGCNESSSGSAAPSVTVGVQPSSSCTAGCTVDSTAKLTVQKPQLWWPNGYGPQKLYRAKATLFAGDSDGAVD
eukprot:SAG11_NODE_38000_length_254_cov_0.670968_1_plen_84_part_11